MSQHERVIEVYRKATGWEQERFSAEQIIKLDQLDLEIPLDFVYKGILS